MSLYRDAETLRALEKETPRGLLLIYYNHFLEISPTLSLSFSLSLIPFLSLTLFYFPKASHWETSFHFILIEMHRRQNNHNYADTSSWK